MRRTLVSFLHGVLSLLTAVGLIYVYYDSPLRGRIEDRLFDVRTRLGLSLGHGAEVAAVLVHDSDIAALDGPQATDLSYAGLRRLLDALRQTQAKLIVVILHAQVYSYDDPALEQLASLAAQEPRLMLGAFNLAAGETGAEALPRVLRPVAEQVGDAGIPRPFRRDVVRKLRLDAPDRFPFLTMRIAERLGLAAELDALPSDAAAGRQLLLNYVGIGATPTFTAVEAMQADRRDALAGRVVFVGYNAFRPWSASLVDATHVNSPWQTDGVDVDGRAMPLALLHAVATGNILQRSWLAEAGDAANIAQSAIMALLTLLMWRGTVGFACLLFIGSWSLLLLGHALLFSLAGSYVPLADTVIASAVALAIGATFKLRQEGRHRAIAEAESASKAELASVQNQFLDAFTRELGRANRYLRTLIDFPLPADAGVAGAGAHARLKASSSELDEYLVGMEQLSAVDAARGKTSAGPELRPVPLRVIISRLAQQFEAKLEENRQRLVVDCPEDFAALADSYLLQQIAYNLVSNAVKYSPPEAEIRIAVTRQGREVVLAVSDQGPGIAPEHQDKIFEKFYRVKDDLVYKVKGHGLGLYLCRFFASQIGGRIELESALGAGSTFRLRLRAA